MKKILFLITLLSFLFNTNLVSANQVSKNNYRQINHITSIKNNPAYQNRSIDKGMNW